jgi:hypothetical protein
LCRELGETLGGFVPASERVGVDYVRQADVTAAGTLADVIGGVPWWVGQDGLTHVGARGATPLNPSAYELLAFDPRLRMATLGVPNDIGPITIGATLVDKRIDRPAVMREYTVAVAEDNLRVHAYCGGDESTPGNLASLLTSIVQRIMDERLLGRFRYRVIDMRSDGRVDVQAVNRAAGTPDLQYISMWPGVAGVHAELTPGAEVLVEFVEGDRAQPIITGFVGNQGPGFVPVGIVFGDPDEAAAVGRVGDSVQVTPSAGHQIALNVASFTYMVPLGICSAAAVRVGHAMGAHDAHGAARAGWTSDASIERLSRQANAVAAAW